MQRIGDKHPKYNYTMTAEDGTIVQLEETVMEKDLGVVVDNKLTFSQHINSTVVKANQVVGMIRRSFKYMMDKEICVQLFTSRVRPILQYGNNVIWNPRLIRDIGAIERVQRRATKAVPVQSTMYYPDRRRTLRLPSLVFRGDMIETYKFLHNVYDLTQSHPDRPLAAIYDLPRSAISGQRAPVYTELMFLWFQLVFNIFSIIG